MGIKKLNKKNPPTPASFPSATPTEVDVLIHIVQVPLLICGGNSTRRAGRGSRRREDQPCKCYLQIARLIFS